MNECFNVRCDVHAMFVEVIVLPSLVDLITLTFEFRVTHGYPTYEVAVHSGSALL